jgi:hypothetical protein
MGCVRLFTRCEIPTSRKEANKGLISAASSSGARGDHPSERQEHIFMDCRSFSTLESAENLHLFSFCRPEPRCMIWVEKPSKRAETISIHWQGGRLPIWLVGARADVLEKSKILQYWSGFIQVANPKEPATSKSSLPLTNSTLKLGIH